MPFDLQNWKNETARLKKNRGKEEFKKILYLPAKLGTRNGCFFEWNN